MDSPLLCVNNGGLDSLIRLDHVPRLEAETPLSAKALLALSYWQARVGETLTVIDPEATAYRVRITSLDPEYATCVPFQRLTTPVESPLCIEVYLSLSDKERFEIVLQKLTELGVARIVPLESQHSETLEARDSQQSKSHRWSEVINLSSRQSRRAMLPELMPAHTFSEALACARSAELKLMLCDGDATWTIMEGFGSFKPQSVALLIGPEKDFSPEDLVQAQAEAFLPISLGPRIMCTETTAIVAAALVQSYLGDLA